jgi:hypothetical protein
MGAARRRQGRPDREQGGPLVQGPVDAAHRLFDQLDADAGEVLGEAAEHLGHERGAGARIGRERHVTPDQALHRGHRGPACVEFLDHGPGVRHEGLPRRGQPGRPLVAVEQLRAELAFQ